MTATTGPTTLAIDIGASGLKASVLDATGAIVVERVRVKATYPCPAVCGGRSYGQERSATRRRRVMSA